MEVIAVKMPDDYGLASNRLSVGDSAAVQFRVPNMSSESAFIRAEIPEIEKIVKNEVWLEGERRGQPVDRHDEVVRQRVAEIILNGAGRHLRTRIGSV